MMPQIWMDNDNADAILLPKSARKAISESAGKKSVLTKLENVIHSHKSHPTLLKDSNTKWPKSSICKETPQKQHRQQLQEKSYAGQSIAGGLWKAAELSAANNLNKCLRNCQKPISPNWMEPLLSEQLIDKLLNNTLAEDELRVPDIPAYPELDEDEFALKSLTDKLNESVEKSTEVFEVMLPPVLYDIDFDEEPFKF
ncbi:GH13413 [Drosophila grimshawi]|uniref:GH13413 n=1 Tax=Drosophila grimshawi TaxID=7222 RepID=B4JPF7_DROGR|nr:GH13413 [Drosophila grimshawi]